MVGLTLKLQHLEMNTGPPTKLDRTLYQNICTCLPIFDFICMVEIEIDNDRSVFMLSK